MSINVILLILLVLTVLWTVMTTRLLRAVMGLAVASVILSILMYQLASPIAAVFELSVCAGLISVIFFTAISFTQRVSKGKLSTRQKERFNKFWYLPFIIVIAGIALSQNVVPIDFEVPTSVTGLDVRQVLWNLRHFDLIGQIVILLAGAFGVIVLFKEKAK